MRPEILPNETPRKQRILIPGDPEDVTAYVAMLTRLGAQPEVTMQVPSGAEAAFYDALVIPGGEDIDPSRYGQKNTGCRKIDPRMDALQFDTLALFLEAGKPVLGICNGMQMINIFFGGDLIQDIPTRENHQRRAGAFSWHEVHAPAGSLWARRVGEQFGVNSAHHQAVGRLGKDLEVTLRAPDGVVEGIAHRTLPVLGLQFHPERMVEETGQAADGTVFYRTFLEMLQQKG